MEPQWILSVLTIVCSGVVSAIVTYKLNKKKDERQFMRQKLEELNLALLRFCTQMGSYFLNFSSVMTGKITYNQALDIVNKSTNIENYYDKISLILNIYFPQFNSHLEQIHNARDEGNEIVFDFKRFYDREGIHSQDHFRKMSVVINQLDKAETDFKLAIQREARIIK